MTFQILGWRFDIAIFSSKSYEFRQLLFALLLHSTVAAYVLSPDAGSTSVNFVHSCLLRNPADQKPTLNFLILGYDVSLIDNKESKKSYCIKISHPTQETYYFATDSRVSIERWIEVLSLAATGRLDVIAPYPPYFCAEQSGDELKSRSRESLLSSEV